MPLLDYLPSISNQGFPSPHRAARLRTFCQLDGNHPSKCEVIFIFSLVYSSLAQLFLIHFQVSIDNTYVFSGKMSIQVVSQTLLFIILVNFYCGEEKKA